MNITSSPFHTSQYSLASLAFAIALLGVAAPVAHAERADRAKPLNVEADNGRYDDAKQAGTFTGNVVVTKGSMVMRAAKIEVRQNSDGYQFGVATAGGGKPATFRQKREGIDEFIEGEAERIEYDGRADQIRFIDRAVIRRFRGSVLADETAGSLITYDNAAEVFSVAGGASAATASNPGGRVRAVLTPREGSPAAADGTAAPGAAPAASQPGITLRPSPSLGTKP